MANFQERFLDLKLKKNVTYKDIADVLRISPRAVQHYSDGRRFPDFHGLLALADYFDVSLDYLVGRSEERERR